MPHPRDLSPDLLTRALAEADRPDLLQQLVDTSRRIWGIYTSHIPHTVNYPWVVARLESLPASSNILDMGAGVTPLPLLLAEKGFHVQTVDPNPIVRTTKATGDWNEWGYFDYSQLHPNLNSAHCSIGDFVADKTFDAIYSISVLAHMARPIREEALKKCHDLLCSGGLLLLAIDLIPTTNYLWNYSSGHMVEVPEKHGTIYDVIEQLKSLNFEILESEGRRAVAMARTDLAFIACHRR